MADRLSFLPGSVNSTEPRTQLKYFTSYDNGINSQARLLIPLTDNELEIFDPSKLTNDLGTEAALSQVVGDVGYIDFLLETADESYNEKVQTVEFLSDDFTSYFFGQHAPQFNYTGTLFTTYQDDWWTRFQGLYNNVLRGSAARPLGRLVTLRYDSRLISGALINFNAHLQSDRQSAVNVAFSMIVKSVDIVPPLNAIPIPADLSLIGPAVPDGSGVVGVLAAITPPVTQSSFAVVRDSGVLASGNTTPESVKVGAKIDLTPTEEEKQLRSTEIYNSRQAQINAPVIEF